MFGRQFKTFHRFSFYKEIDLSRSQLIQLGVLVFIRDSERVGSILCGVFQEHLLIDLLDSITFCHNTKVERSLMPFESMNI